eukprot:503516_1
MSSPTPSSADRIFALNQESDMLCWILDVSISPSQSSSSSATFLPDISEVAIDFDLPDRLQKPRLTRAHLDLAIIERLTLPFRRNSLRYLLECYDRAATRLKESTHQRGAEVSREVLQFALDQVALYCCRIIDSEITTDRDREQCAREFRLIMEAMPNERKFPDGFLTKFVTHLDDVQVVFHPYLQTVAQNLPKHGGRYACEFPQTAGCSHKAVRESPDSTHGHRPPAIRIMRRPVTGSQWACVGARDATGRIYVSGRAIARGDGRVAGRAWRERPGTDDDG